MAKIQLFPGYVQSALTADRTAQIGTIGAVCVYLFGAIKAEQEVSELGATLHKAAPHRSLKTWQNYASTCTAVASNATFMTKMESLWSAAKDPADTVPLLSQWLDALLTRHGYHTSPEDVGNWAKGRPSIKAQAKAAKEAEKAAAAQKIADDAKAAAQKIIDDQAAAQRVLDKAEEDKAAADIAAAAALKKAAEVQPEAPPTPDAPRNPDGSLPPAILGGAVLTVTRESDGFALVISESLTSDELRAIAESILASADARTVTETAPA